VSPMASSAIIRPPEADPVMPATTLVAAATETSGPPGIDASASRTPAKAGSAATTAPKLTMLAVFSTGSTEALAPACMVSRSAGRQRRFAGTTTTIAASRAAATDQMPPTTASEVAPRPSRMPSKPMVPYRRSVRSPSLPSRRGAKAQTRPPSQSRSLPWRIRVYRPTNGAWKAPLGETIALGMVFRQRHVQLAERLFDRIHHHVRSADEVLVIRIWRRQMALEHCGRDEAVFSRPVGWRIRQHVNDRQVEPRCHRFQLLAEGDRLPILAAIEQNHGPLVAAVGEGADHANHRGDANAACDQHVHVGRVAVDGESAVRPVEVDALRQRHLVDRAREVAEVPDRHLDASVRDGGAG